MRNLLIVAAGLGLAAAAHAGPVVVDLSDRATARAAVVTVADVGRVFGGDPATRTRVAGLDLADLPARGSGVTVTRKAVEYRLRLAGMDPADFMVIGAEKVGVVPARRTVTVDEVVTAAKAELTRVLPPPADGYAVELVGRPAVKFPEVPAAEAVTVTAQPHSKVTGPGRVQMDVTLSAGGERLLAFALLFEVKAVPGPMTLPTTVVGTPGSVVPAAATAPAGEVLVRTRQRVRIAVRSGALIVTAVGEALQDGKLGQPVQVQNVDSKKVLTARVSGPGAVEVELGGVP